MAKGPVKGDAKAAFVIGKAFLDTASNFQNAVNGFNSQGDWAQVQGTL